MPDEARNREGKIILGSIDDSSQNEHLDMGGCLHPLLSTFASDCVLLLRCDFNWLTPHPQRTPSRRPFHFEMARPKYASQTPNQGIIMSSSVRPIIFPSTSHLNGFISVR